MANSDGRCIIRSRFLEEYSNVFRPLSAGTRPRSLITKVQNASSLGCDGEESDTADDVDPWVLEGWGDEPSVPEKARQTCSKLSKYRKNIPHALPDANIARGGRRAMSAGPCGRGPAKPAEERRRRPPQAGQAARHTKRQVYCNKPVTLDVGDESDIEPEALQHAHCIPAAAPRAASSSSNASSDVSSTKEAGGGAHASGCNLPGQQEPASGQLQLYSTRCITPKGLPAATDQHSLWPHTPPGPNHLSVVATSASNQTVHFEQTPSTPSPSPVPASRHGTSSRHPPTRYEATVSTMSSSPIKPTNGAPVDIMAAATMAARSTYKQKLAEDLDALVQRRLALQKPSSSAAAAAGAGAAAAFISGTGETAASAGFLSAGTSVSSLSAGVVAQRIASTRGGPGHDRSSLGSRGGCGDEAQGLGPSVLPVLGLEMLQLGAPQQLKQQSSAGQGSHVNERRASQSSGTAHAGLPAGPSSGLSRPQHHASRGVTARRQTALDYVTEGSISGWETDLSSAEDTLAPAPHKPPQHSSPPKHFQDRRSPGGRSAGISYSSTSIGTTSAAKATADLVYKLAQRPNKAASGLGSSPTIAATGMQRQAPTATDPRNNELERLQVHDSPRGDGPSESMPHKASSGAGVAGNVGLPAAASGLMTPKAPNVFDGGQLTFTPLVGIGLGGSSADPAAPGYARGGGHRGSGATAAARQLVQQSHQHQINADMVVSLVSVGRAIT